MTETFLERAVSDLASGYTGIMVSLGNKLGLYKVLAQEGGLTSQAVAAKAHCAERYVREWLNSQVAAGYVFYDAESETYALPDEHVDVLANDESPTFIPSAWQVPASMWFDEGKSIAAFRTGEGVPWGNHNGRLYCGVAAFYRNAYRGSLVQEWLPSLDGVVDRLTQGIRVADVGCGHGHSTCLMADAFPESEFWGFDTHRESIMAARNHADEAGVTDRTNFEIATAKNYEGHKFDLICFFDCLHDLGDPVGAARHAADCLKKDGTVVLVEPFAHDAVENNTGPVGQLYYSASTTLCCAHSLSEDVGLALGAQAGPNRLREVFSEAGFSHFRTATETPFNMVLEVRR